MPILLTDPDVRNLLTMSDAVAVVETALSEFQTGAAVNLPRHHFYSQAEKATFFMRNFQGSVPRFGYAGMRLTTDMLGQTLHRPDLRPFGTFLLFDVNTAALLAVIHDHELQRIRVGAESGVAIRWMARHDAQTVGLLGAGFQAESQLMAATTVRQITSVDVFSPTTERCEAFAAKLSSQLNISINPVESAEKAVRNKDLVLASTNATKPVLNGAWLAEGTHVTSIVNSDQTFPRRELDDETFHRAQLVAIGYLEQTKQDHAADIYGAIQAGALDWNRVCQLGEIITARRPGRTDQRQITIYKNNGLAVEFVALAGKVYELAKERNVGEEIPDRYFSRPRTR